MAAVNHLTLSYADWLEIERETMGCPGVWLDVTQFQQRLAKFDRDQSA